MLSPLKLTPNMPTEVMIDAINQNFRQIESESRRKVVTDENGYDRIVIGRQEDGTYSIKVSADGYDVGTATDDQLVMSSDWKMWKIINSGSAYMNPNSIRRSGTVSLTSTNIGYTSDIFIYVEGLSEILNASSWTGKIQMFVRENSTKSDIADSNILYRDDSGNWATYNHSYFVHQDGYIVIRTDIRWMSGTYTMTPRSDGLPVSTAYWEIANPTRAVPGGMGGGGSPTGKYVYYDSVIYNSSSSPLYGYDDSFVPTTVASGAFSALRSYTYQFFDNASSWKYPKEHRVIPYPPLSI